MLLMRPEIPQSTSPCLTPPTPPSPWPEVLLQPEPASAYKALHRFGRALQAAQVRLALVGHRLGRHRETGEQLRAPTAAERQGIHVVEVQHAAGGGDGADRGDEAVGCGLGQIVDQACSRPGADPDQGRSQIRG